MVLQGSSSRCALRLAVLQHTVTSSFRQCMIGMCVGGLEAGSTPFSSPSQLQALSLQGSRRCGGGETVKADLW